MNAAASAGSSCAISSSIFAQIGTARVAAPGQERLEARRVRPRRSACGRSASSRLRTRSSGLADRNWKPRSRLASSAVRAERAERLPFLERASGSAAGCPAPCSSSALLPFLRSRSSRSSRRSTTPRSARMTSSSIVRTSRAGSTDARRMRHRRIAKHPDDVQQRVGVAERRDVEQRLRARLARRRRRRCRRTRRSRARACAG